MFTLGIVLVVLGALMGAVGAVVRDRRLTGREVVVQLSWAFAFIGVSILFMIGVVGRLNGRPQMVALALWFVWMVGGIVVLARYLKTRLARAGREERAGEPRA